MFVQLFKTASEIVVSAGVSTIVSTVVKQAMPDNLSRYKKVAVVAGTIALSGAASSAATKYTNDQIDQVVLLGKMGGKFKDQFAENLKKNLDDKQVVVDAEHGVTVETKEESK